MAALAVSGYYATPEWSHPPTLVAGDAEAAAPALAAPLALVPIAAAPVQGVDGIGVDLNLALVDAPVCRYFVPKVSLLAALRLLTATGLICVFKFVPAIKASTPFSKDNVPREHPSNDGMDTYFDSIRVVAQCMTATAFVCVTCLNMELPRQQRRSSRWFFLMLLMVIPAIGLCIARLHRISWDLTTGSGPWWTLLMFTVSGLWCFGAGIYIVVTHWHWGRQLILLSCFVGANLTLAVHCMWSFQRGFGGVHERRNVHKPQDWMFCSVLLSTLVLTNHLLSVPLANWVLLGWEHMGYRP